MSQADVSYSCGSCGYPLNLTSSNRIATSIGSEYRKSVEKGLISFLSVDLSRFTQVDEVHCFPVSWGRHRSKTKLLCRKCGVHIGYGYGDAPALCGFDSPDSSSAAFRKFTIKIRALQPSDETDRESFGLTCHRWLNIQNLNRRSLQFPCSFGIVGTSSLSQSCTNINSFHLYRILARFQHLEYLSLSGCIEILDSALSYLKPYGSKLQTLCLDCCFKISDYGISLVGDGCPFLTTISLYRCSITDTGLEALANACLALRHVNLAYCACISDSGLRALSQGCRELQAVKISNCRGVSGVGLRGCSSTLVYIDAECCNLEPEGIMSIVSGGGLKFLNIASLSCSNFRNGLEAIGNGFAARLKILNLRMCRSVTDASIVAIAKGCPQLQEWNLALCHEVRVLGWASIGSNCHNLKKLHVNRCRNLCHQGLQALRDGCKELSVLYMSRNSQISDTALELFKLYRCNVEIKAEEVMSVGPNWDSIDEST
ncbi:F-box/LRR-repeat protein 12-like [Gossypium australe]|uniref:F-box/LRR-repeat protein 12-like n=1 Tax=Gossypium australe TaxID=47621 RepID=A0A5B6W0I0_9ROSI|nr:F-box/LRR-repeat protein 12-like [Gossypium australe]